jgi:hypothetical protein
MLKPNLSDADEDKPQRPKMEKERHKNGTQVETVVCPLSVNASMSLRRGRAGKAGREMEETCWRSSLVERCECGEQTRDQPQQNRTALDHT